MASASTFLNFLRRNNIFSKSQFLRMFLEENNSVIFGNFRKATKNKASILDKITEKIGNPFKAYTKPVNTLYSERSLDSRFRLNTG